MQIAMQHLPDEKIKQSKLFNGNIKNPEEFIFIWIFILLVMIGFLVWEFISLPKEVGMDDLSVYHDTIADYRFEPSDNDKKRLVITLTANEGTFITWDMDEKTSQYDNFKKDVADDKTFELYYQKDDLKGETTEIYLLSCDKEIYVSLEKINKDNSEIRSLFIGMVLFFIICWILYIIISVYVMSHADKYPRLIRLFVKSRYINQK